MLVPQYLFFDFCTVLYATKAFLYSFCLNRITPIAASESDLTVVSYRWVGHIFKSRNFFCLLFILQLIIATPQPHCRILLRLLVESSSAFVYFIAFGNKGMAAFYNPLIIKLHPPWQRENLICLTLAYSVNGHRCLIG